MVNWHKLRSDFPVLSKKAEGKPIVYFDNACVSLKPQQVVEAMNGYYTDYTACHGRSFHRFARTTTQKFEDARGAVARFINAGPAEIVFTRNTTESVNLVANSFPFKKGDVVLTTDMEHNSNLIPWQKLQKVRGVRHQVFFTNPDGTFNRKNFEEKMSKDVKLVSIVHTSNLFGTTLPAGEIIKIVHDYGAKVLLDAAQSVPHRPVDVKKLDADFLAFSGHKALGPSGTGVLFGKAALLEELDTFIVGGDTVSDSTYEGCTFQKAPAKFEAGLQDYAGVIGLGAAIDYLSKIGMDNVAKRDEELAVKLINGLFRLQKVGLLGGKDPKDTTALASFNVEGMESHDVSIVLDEIANIFVRSGRYCVHSWFNAHKIPGATRASLYFYNTEDEIELFVETLATIIKDLT